MGRGGRCVAADEQIEPSNAQLLASGLPPRTRRHLCLRVNIVVGSVVSCVFCLLGSPL